MHQEREWFKAEGIEVSNYARENEYQETKKKMLLSL